MHEHGSHIRYCARKRARITKALGSLANRPYHPVPLFGTAVPWRRLHVIQAAASPPPIPPTCQSSLQ